MSIARRDTWMETAVRYLVEMENRARQRRKEYEDRYGRIVDTATRQVVGNIRKLEKH